MYIAAFFFFFRWIQVFVLPKHLHFLSSLFSFTLDSYTHLFTAQMGYYPSISNALGALKVFLTCFLHENVFVLDADNVFLLNFVCINYNLELKFLQSESNIFLSVMRRWTLFCCSLRNRRTVAAFWHLCSKREDLLKGSRNKELDYWGTL